MIRLGALKFSNALPFFYALTEQIIPNNIQFHWGSPIETHELLHSGTVDVALISSASFLDDRLSYTLLSDLGIAATKEVLSVRLFFKGDAPDLHQKTVLVPSISITSTKMLKILSKYFWNVSPNFEPYMHSPNSLFKQDSPFLVIGDSCLEFLKNNSHNSIDLAQAWNEATKKSFIFSVFATRNDAFKQNPQGIIDFHRILEDSFMWSQENTNLLAEKGAEMAGCDIEIMRHYYSLLKFRLDSKGFHGLDYFSTFPL